MQRMVPQEETIMVPRTKMVPVQEMVPQVVTKMVPQMYTTTQQVLVGLFACTLLNIQREHHGAIGLLACALLCVGV